MRFVAYLLFYIAHFQIISFGVSQQSVGARCVGSDGGEGICQLVRDCLSAQEDIKKGLRPKTCGFQGKEAIVCCPAPAPSPTRTRIPGEIARKRCQEYQTLCLDSILINSERIIAGGVEAEIGEFPHMAAIGYGNEDDIKWNCGGSLISEKFVLTAAHCMNSGITGPAKWVLLGTVDLINTTATDGRNGQIHPITKRISHPKYQPPAKYNDIALFEIGPAVTPNSRSLNEIDLHPACLSEEKEFSGKKAIATGWGRVAHFDDGSSHLLKVTLDVFNLSLCQETYDVEIRSSSLLKDGIVPTMLCAGVLKGKRDTCQGDSGGPLQVPVSNCKYEVWGVTSFGKICAYPNAPSVYSKVSEYVPWIEDIVWPA